MNNAVLIVDDSEDTRELFKATLEAEGFAVLTAEGGPEALEILGSHTPALMLLDLRMPGMSGVQVLHAMERLGLAPNLPVMVVSAMDELSNMRLPLSVIGTLQKPFFYPELIYKIRSILNLRQETREAHP